MSDITMQIRQETRLLSRYAGLIAAKYLTFVLLLFGFFCLGNNAVYIALLDLLLPRLLQYLFSSNQKNMAAPFLLTHTMQKYYFTIHKYQAEKCAAPILLLILLFWQTHLNTQPLAFPWRILPAFLVVCHVLSRLLTKTLFRLYLHRQFLSLHTLD